MTVENLTGITLETSWWEAGLRLLLALLFAGVIGWEREIKGRPAGLRTYMLVGLGSAVFSLVAMELFETLLETDRLARADPTRLLEGVVGGIGFLGAGAIIQAGGRIRGLTTAAGMWVTASVGLAVGAGYYSLAVIAFVLALITLAGLRHLEIGTKNDRGEEYADS